MIFQIKTVSLQLYKLIQLQNGAPATISKWCTNSAQPNMENLVEIAKCLEVTVNDLIR